MIFWLRRLRCRLLGHRWRRAGVQHDDRWCPRCRVLTFSRPGVEGDVLNATAHWTDGGAPFVVVRREGKE